MHTRKIGSILKESVNYVTEQREGWGVRQIKDYILWVDECLSNDFNMDILVDAINMLEHEADS